jgi:hypothetical protein
VPTPAAVESTRSPTPSARPRQPVPDLRSDLKDPFAKSDDDIDGESSPNLKDPFHKAPAPAARRTSTLRVGVLPGARPATVTIDGHVVGTTPIANHRVTPGEHRIRWDWDDGHSFAQTITIADGEVQLVKGG